MKLVILWPLPYLKNCEQHVLYSPDEHEFPQGSNAKFLGLPSQCSCAISCSTLVSCLKAEWNKPSNELQPPAIPVVGSELRNSSIYRRSTATYRNSQCLTVTQQQHAQINEPQFMHSSHKVTLQSGFRKKQIFLVKKNPLQTSSNFSSSCQ